MRSTLLSIGKYILAVILLIVILRNAQGEKILGYMKQLPLYKLVLSFTLISLAQIASALRMRFFFRAAGFEIHRSFAIILFYVGAFYNFLLPGGIGGDAYKVFLVRKRMSVTAAQGIRIMVADRASGLCIVLLNTLVALWLLDLSGLTRYAHALLLAGGVVTFAGYLFFSRWLVKMNPLTMIASLPYSIATQALWIAALINILSSLGDIKYAPEYIALYCASSITGLLPVSVGGLGIKEMTYYYGAAQLQHFAHSGVDGNLGVALSLCLFVLMFATAMPGLLWLNKVEKAEHS